MGRFRRDDETADHVDLLDRLEDLDPPRSRVLTLVHAADEAQESFAWKIRDKHVIGRDPGRGGIEVLDPGASRRHAEVILEPNGGRTVVRDLGSRNGTFVDGQRQTSAELHHGSVVRVADSIFAFADVRTDGLPSAMPRRDTSLTLALTELRADLAAPSTLSVLIVGPTGAGKERLAQRIHDGSGRSGRLVAVNCGALNRELIASELFGHAAGAFSGAATSREGLFVAANRGTLFLDEIADLPLDQQPALLRTLQEKSVRPVGSDTEIKVDVRIVSATHKPLAALVEEQHFRRDLFARLSGLTLELPGLENRREEILPLFVKLSGLHPRAISADAAEALVLSDWPGNVRDLQHLCAQLELMATSEVDIATLPPEFSARLTTLRRGQADAGRTSSPRELTRDGLVALLQEHRGNVATIAKVLGKHRAQVYRWLRREELDPDSYRLPGPEAPDGDGAPD